MLEVLVINDKKKKRILTPPTSQARKKASHFLFTHQPTRACPGTYHDLNATNQRYTAKHISTTSFLTSAGINRTHRQSLMNIGVSCALIIWLTWDTRCVVKFHPQMVSTWNDGVDGGMQVILICWKVCIVSTHVFILFDITKVHSTNIFPFV